MAWMYKTGSLSDFAGYPCTRFIVGPAWVCEGLPQEPRWTLASTGEAESGDGYLCHSPRAEGSAEDYLRLLTEQKSVPKALKAPRRNLKAIDKGSIMKSKRHW